MKLFCYLDRITTINRLINQERTGCPDQFATRLRISRTRLYEILDEIKSYGAPIAYDKTRQTYYYERPFEVSVKVNIRPLNINEEKNVNAGCIFFSKSFFSGRCQNTFAL
ncbi:MAG: hypothetical protein RBT19_05825 [Tenuifilaceae bacterium]|nr:hypothetical protein [Tenuifilaceae bacterium]